MEASPVKSLPDVFIKRDFDNDPAGPTFGKLTAPGGFECDTLERPLTVADHPRIPIGAYKVHAFNHPTHGLCYELQNVPGRTGILIHKANWWIELLGCVALGRSVQLVIDEKGKWLGHPGAKQMGVTSSDDAVKAFWNHMDGHDFMLTIS